MFPMYLNVFINCFEITKGFAKLKYLLLGRYFYL